MLEVLIDELDIVDAELLQTAFMKDMGVTPESESSDIPHG